MPNFLRGYRDKEGKYHTYFEVKGIDGRDEEAISKSEVRNSATKVIQILEERCITRIGDFVRKDTPPKEWSEIISSLSVGDRDVAVLEIRKETLGDEIEVNHVCPNPDCKCKIHTTISVSEDLEITNWNGLETYDFELPKGVTVKGVTYNAGTMRLHTAKDMLPLDKLSKTNPSMATTALLAKCILKLDGYDGKIDENLVKSMQYADRKFLLDVLNNEFKHGISTVVSVECPECYERFDATLDTRNFL